MEPVVNWECARALLMSQCHAREEVDDGSEDGQKRDGSCPLPLPPIPIHNLVIFRRNDGEHVERVAVKCERFLTYAVRTSIRFFGFDYSLHLSFQRFERDFV